MGYVFQRLEEAVEIHLGVLAAAHHVLVYDVVVCLGDVRVRHRVEFCQPLKLVRRYEIVILLPCQHLKDGFRLGVKIKLVVVAVRVWQDQLQKTLLRWALVERLIRGASCLALFTLRVLPWRLIKNARCRYEVKGVCE